MAAEAGNVIVWRMCKEHGKEIKLRIYEYENMVQKYILRIVKVFKKSVYRLGFGINECRHRLKVRQPLVYEPSSCFKLL